MPPVLEGLSFFSAWIARKTPGAEWRIPHTNDKVERFHQTMTREWGRGRAYPSSAHSASLLPDLLEHHNHRRPHSALGNRPPISRVHNL
jgi:transposase InsO family protein